LLEQNFTVRMPSLKATSGPASSQRCYLHHLRTITDILHNVTYRGVKAKLHYASWFKAGRRQVRSQIPLRYLVRTSSEPDSVMEFGGEPASSC